MNIQLKDIMREAKSIMIDFINNNLMPDGKKASIASEIMYVGGPDFPDFSGEVAGKIHGKPYFLRKVAVKEGGLFKIIVS